MATDKRTTDLSAEEQAYSPDEVLKDARQIMKAATNEAGGGLTDGGGGKLGDPPVTDSFKGLPMRDLIGAPLIAAAEAQQNLAAVAWDFYQKIAFVDPEKGKETDPLKTRLLEFEIDRPTVVDGKPGTIKQKIKAPFIGLVPIPSLLIDRITIDFQMEVSDNNVQKNETKADVTTTISSKKWWPVTAEITGKVSSSRETTRTTNQTAKYQVTVNASQQPQTEGLSKLMDIMASCIEPIVVEKSEK